jgi:hypothetical protein
MNIRCPSLHRMKALCRSRHRMKANRWRGQLFQGGRTNPGADGRNAGAKGGCDVSLEPDCRIGVEDDHSEAKVPSNVTLLRVLRPVQKWPEQAEQETCQCDPDQAAEPGDAQRGATTRSGSRTSIRSAA